MKTRILIGGLVGGAVMFLWGAVSHMVLNLGQSAIKRLPNEASVIGILQTNLKETGFYFFPGMDEDPNATKEQKEATEKAWKEKYLAGPRGVLIYHPDGEQAMSPRQLLSQLGATIIAGLVAAIALAQAAGLKSYKARVTFVASLALLPLFVVNFPYWNWYGFPTNFTLWEFADKLISFLLAGFALAAIVKPRSAPAAGAA